MAEQQTLPLTLLIITPKGKQPPLFCDSVQLTVSDNTDGKNGGSYGIRKGHIKALLSLDTGTIHAYLDGAKILAAKAGNGFASVDSDTVTVVVDEYTVEK